MEQIFDSHAHYDDEAFDEDRDSLLSSFPDKGIGCVVNIGADMESSKKSADLAAKYPYLYAAVGIHPSAAQENSPENIKILEEMADYDKVVAIGEIGLDYHYEPVKKAEQKSCFDVQLQLAKKLDLPVVIHSREAAQDTLEILKSSQDGSSTGVIHCFSYGKEMAREYLNMGYYIGIGGVLTFGNAKKLREVTDYIPLECILIETDCPYLAPVPNRGKRNSSLNLPYVVKAVADIKGVPEEEVVRITAQNARRLYRIKDTGSEYGKDSHRNGD